MTWRGGLALGLIGAAAGVAAERAAMSRERGRFDPAAADDLSPLDDAKHHTIATSDGGEVHLVERGEGRPILLLHGVTLSTVTWHYQLVDLADAGFRVLATDHRGHGRSSGGRDGYSIERLAEDVFEVLQHLDLRDVVVAGHSLGGMVLLRLLADHRELARGAGRISAVALVNTSASPVAGAGVPAAAALLRAVSPVATRGMTWASRLPGGMVPSNDLSYLFTRGAFGTRPSPTHVELTRAMTSATPAPVIADLTRSIFELDLRPSLADIKLPTTVIVGSRDNLTPSGHSRALANSIPDAQLNILPGCGHMSMLERRNELAVLLRQLAERSISSFQ